MTIEHCLTPKFKSHNVDVNEMSEKVTSSLSWCSRLQKCVWSSFHNKVASFTSLQLHSIFRTRRAWFGIRLENSQELQRYEIDWNWMKLISKHKNVTMRMCTNCSDWIPISAKLWNTLEHAHLAFSPKKTGFATRRSTPARRKPVARTFGISCKEILGPFYIFCSGSLFFRELFVELLTQLF